MPAKMFMSINNGNYTNAQLAAFHAKMVNVQKPKASSALNTSIISRIHNVKPGCGSCGK